MKVNAVILLHMHPMVSIRQSVNCLGLRHDYRAYSRMPSGDLFVHHKRMATGQGEVWTGLPMLELKKYPTIDQRQRFEIGLYNVPLAFPAIATFRPQDVAHPVGQHIPKPAWYS